VTGQVCTEFRGAVDVFSEMAHTPGSVLLESQSGGGYSAIYTEPFEILDSGSPFDALREALAHNDRSSAVGFLGYEAHRFLEDSPVTAADDIGLPDSWLGLYTAPIIFASRGEGSLQDALRPPGVRV